MNDFPRISYHFPGAPAPTVEPGDIILTHSTFLTGKIIRFGQRLRWRGSRKWAAHWNHAVLVIQGEITSDRRQLSNGGSIAVVRPAQIVEALGKGVEQNGLYEYRDTEYAVIHMNLYHRDLYQIRAFTRSVLEKKTHYGYVELLSLGLSLLTPPWFQFGQPGTMICSGFVAEAMTRAGVIWQVDPAYVMPAHIAELYYVWPSDNPDTDYKPEYSDIDDLECAI